MYDDNNSAIVILKRFSLCFRIAEDATTLKLEDDLNAEETSSEDEDELTQERHGLQDVWERDEGEESWDEDENEDKDEQEGDDEDEGANEDEHEHEGDDDDEDEDEDSNEDEHKQEGDDDDEDEDSNEDEYSTSMRATMTGMK